MWPVIMYTAYGLTVKPDFPIYSSCFIKKVNLDAGHNNVTFSPKML